MIDSSFDNVFEQLGTMSVYFVWVDVTKFEMEFAFSVNLRNNGNAFEKNHYLIFIPNNTYEY